MSHTGDAYTIGHSALRVFSHWPGLSEENEKISHDFRLYYCKPNGERLTQPLSVLADNPDPEAPSRMYRCIRPKFQKILYDYLSKIGLAIEWDKQVTEYYEDAAGGKAGVVMSNGERIESELVIAADGVGSKSYKLVTENPVPSRSSGYAIFRASFQAEHVADDEDLLARFPAKEDGSPVIETWMGFVDR